VTAPNCIYPMHSQDQYKNYKTNRQRYTVPATEYLQQNLFINADVFHSIGNLGDRIAE